MKPAFLLTLLSGSLVFAYSQDSDLRALLVSPSSNIDPVPANPSEPFVTDPQRRQTPRTIEGLLIARQISCQAGWGYCPNLPGRCCPIGGQCCSNGHCCPSGQVCYLTGCCRRSESGCGGGCCPSGSSCCGGSGKCCAAGSRCVTIEDRITCCPNGQTCDACTEKGYPKCSNEPDYCCPRGQQCYRDGSNAVRCRNPPPPDPPKQDPPKQDPPPKQDAPKQDTPKQDPPSPSPNPPKQDPTTSTTTTTRVSTTTRTPTTTFAASSTTRLVFPTSTEAPAAGYINQVVSLTDPRIAYYGASWVESTSTCFSNIRSRKASGGSHSVRFDFLGTGVFINVAKNVNSGIFSVTILSDTNTTVGSTIEIDAYATSTESSCGIGFAKVGLSPSTYTLVVDILGVSPQASSGSVGTFELLDFVATVPQSGQLNTGPGNGATSIHKDILTSCIIAVSSVFILASLQRLYAS